MGDEERYCVGDKVPFIRAAALGGALDFSGDEREANRFLAGAVASEAKERTEERPGTVFIGEEEDVPLEFPNMVLYDRGGPNILREDLGEVGGVRPIDVLSRRAFPPPEAVIGEVLADSAANPLTDKASGALLPGEARGLGVTWTGYWGCWTTVLMGEEMVL